MLHNKRALTKTGKATPKSGALAVGVMPRIVEAPMRTQFLVQMLVFAAFIAIFFWYGGDVTLPELWESAPGLLVHIMWGLIFSGGVALAFITKTSLSSNAKFAIFAAQLTLFAHSLALFSITLVVTSLPTYSSFRYWQQSRHNQALKPTQKG